MPLTHTSSQESHAHAHGHPAASMQTGRGFHPLPVIGHPEAYYQRHIRQAEELHDPHARACHKIGIHVTQALDPKLPWSEKMAHFRHALDRYCQPPADADAELKGYYQKLADVVRRYASQEAIRLVRQQHEQYSHRLKTGLASRDDLADEADRFFPEFVGHEHGCPPWFTPAAWGQLQQFEQAWI